MSFTIGSLFDGSGGFPLAASLAGGTPVWAAEIEPYPIAVTRSRFPNMKHLGSVTDVKGNEIEPVDVISFGSPCQDLSIAGRRAGLKHEDNGDDETTRSGLFMEAVRIIREMREATNGKYPTFALWENVPGAFSSNKGEDFRVVLEELIKSVEPTAVVPPVPKNGWPYADSYVGDGWSIAYRVFDAQYIRTAQRRRRVFLVFDLRGQRAREVSFERESLRGYFTKSGAKREDVTGDAENCSGAADRTGVSINNLILDDQGGSSINVREDGKAPTIRAEMHGNVPCVMEAQGFDRYNQCLTGEVSETLRTPGGGDNYPSVVYSIENHPADSRVNIDTSGKVQTLTSRMGTGGGNVPMVMEPKAYAMQGFGDYKDCGVASGLKARDYKDATDLVVEETPIVFDKEVYQSGVNATGGHYISEGGPAPTLRTTGSPPGVCVRYIVRRLTPTECARLQGFPDAWGHPDQKEDFTDEEYQFWLNVRNTHAAINGKATKEYTKAQMVTWYNKLHTDSAEYKMWGNGIALPCAIYFMQGIADAMNQ